jgi:hypothetical protein
MEDEKTKVEIEIEKSLKRIADKYKVDISGQLEVSLREDEDN